MLQYQQIDTTEKNKKNFMCGIGFNAFFPSKWRLHGHSRGSQIRAFGFVLQLDVLLVLVPTRNKDLL
jgi:hypothetical protein